MSRRARFAAPLTLELADGTQRSVDAGTCWVDDLGRHVTIAWKGAQGEESVEVAARTLESHIHRRELVFDSW